MREVEKRFVAGVIGGAVVTTAILFAVVFQSCGILRTPTGERPLTTREQVYQAGGVLLGITQELEFAIRNKSIQGETAAKLVQASEVAFAVYRKASLYAIAGDEPAAGTARVELLKLVDALRRELTAALVKP